MNKSRRGHARQTTWSLEAGHANTADFYDHSVLLISVISPVPGHYGTQSSNAKSTGLDDYPSMSLQRFLECYPTVKCDRFSDLIVIISTI